MKMEINRETLVDYILALIKEEREILELIVGGEERWGTDEETQKTKLRLLRKIREDLGLFETEEGE